MRIPISKYHGLGNDFILIQENAIDQALHSDFARYVCNRHTGVGADGLIVVQTNPLTMRYYNADGSSASMCGNGIRTVAHFALDNNLVSSDQFIIETLAGPYDMRIIQHNPFIVSVNMGQPRFDTSIIPMTIEQPNYINEPFIHDNSHYNLTSLRMGATHTVVEVENVTEEQTIRLGKAIQSLPQYPDSTNVNVYTWEDDRTIRLLTYERGVGLTKACGTGATAVYAALQVLRDYTGPLTCILPLGTLLLDCDPEGNIIMTGPSEQIVSGKVSWRLCE